MSNRTKNVKSSVSSSITTSSTSSTSSTNETSEENQIINPNILPKEDLKKFVNQNLKKKKIK